MRILFACTGIEAHGGIQRFNRNLLRAWQDLGASVDVAAVNDAPRAAPGFFGAGGSKPRWLLDLARLASTRRYDHYVCGHIHLAPAVAALLASTGHAFERRTLIVHGIEVWQRLSGLKRTAARHFGQILAVSRYTARSVIEQMPDYPADRIVLFPNTLGSELTATRALHHAPSGNANRLRLLSVARLAASERDKGILHVLEALGELPNHVAFEYSIVGDGDDRSFLEARARALGIAHRVRFRGAVADSELWTCYDSADVFILPSSKEGFGIVFLEAMSFALPVIAASEKGTLDVVHDGGNGYLVPFGDVRAIRDRLVQLAEDPELRMQLGTAGRELVKPGGEFSFDRFRERCARLFPRQARQEVSA